MRQFESGATRDSNEGKLAYIHFMSPHVLTEYCSYLERHRETPNGKRGADNWKAGIPIPVYMESMHRHVHEAWTQFEEGRDIELDTISAIIFNAMGMMYERLRK